MRVLISHDLVLLAFNNVNRMKNGNEDVDLHVYIVVFPFRNTHFPLPELPNNTLQPMITSQYLYLL